MENTASRFGQRLAHTEKKYRDLALKKLTVYLTKKAEWTDLEWDKLWKALFYCMWMSDKRPIQEELSSNLASLVHKLPSVELALGFVHSFFRTMHREWHGIDGLRLDKFYSLVRKFVHESVALLQNNEWEHEDVETFVSILSSEIISQLPNGLRMHLSDLYLEEIYKAAGANVDTEAFLLLLEPFFTLLSSEYDKTIFKRVRELVFAPMLTDYKFGPQPAKKQMKKAAESNESGETDGDEEEEEEDKVFEQVDLAYVQHRIFNIASADDTAERNRSGLYELYSKFFQVTKMDSLKAIQEDASKPKTSPKKKTKKTGDKKQPEVQEAVKAIVSETESSVDSKKNKKNKKRKKSQTDAEPEPEVEASKAVVTPPVATEEPKKSPQKKQKVAEVKTVEPVAVAAVDKKQKKSKKAVEEAETIVKSPAKDEEKVKKAKKDAVVAAESEKKKVKEDKPSKKETPKKSESEVEVKAKKEVVKEAEPSKKEAKKKAKAAKTEKAEAEQKQQQEKPKAAAKQVVVKSGMKFQRCAVCKGFGKSFLPAGKDMCAHCERTQKVQKKAAAVVAKKRKASEIAASSQAAEAEAANAKKVTFGKNKALPHELSVKRLKASAKKEATPKEGIKGVLKTTPSPPAATKATKKDGGKKVSSGKGRMKAADFF